VRSHRFACLLVAASWLIAGCDRRPPVAAVTATTTATTVPAAPVPALADDFEGEGLAPFWAPGSYGSGRYEPGAIVLTSERARSGKSSVRITVKEGDIKQVGGDGLDTERAELDSGKHPLIGRDVWYGFSLFVPAHFPIVDNRLVVAQWKQDDAPGGPLIAQRFRDGRHTLTVRAHGDRRFSLPKLEPGRWHDMIYYVRFSPGADGRIDVWMNGRRVVSVTGPVTVAEGGERINNNFGH
jgi:hypothetical protein